MAADLVRTVGYNQRVSELFSGSFGNALLNMLLVSFYLVLMFLFSGWLTLIALVEAVIISARSTIWFAWAVSTRRQRVFCIKWTTSTPVGATPKPQLMRELAGN